ncbi:hypothetical protein DB30_02825 [Enhygromyxa salina]|uniref:Uncharacterized protein n=1 Tax=Enhygromyxa salina TaxID=215803 RepID=A0A0C2DDS5_9BACT|nr:hypothetical protein [Enhygromyxa salina]KIG17792.1 hypothetical protein DB30_02825 [Enhygromyxa salina]
MLTRRPDNLGNEPWQQPPQAASNHEAVTGQFVDGTSEADMAAGKSIGSKHRFIRRAAQAFGSAYVSKSIADGREYFSYIVENDKRYAHTSVFRGPQPYWVVNPNAATDTNQKPYSLVKDLGNNIPKPPPQAVATVHTHGPAGEGTTTRASATDHTGFREYFNRFNLTQHYVISGTSKDVLFGPDRPSMSEYRVDNGNKSPGPSWSEVGKHSKGTGPTVWERETPARALPRF